MTRRRPGFFPSLLRRIVGAQGDAPPADEAAAPFATAAPKQALAAMVAARQFRLFVSSTFIDMQAERDELVLRVFPRIQRLCRARGVQFLPIDLRWGVTEAQADRGEILRICFDQVDRCRPFFLGLIGARYGWVPGPEALRDHLHAGHAWARAHPAASVTELEFRRGLSGRAGGADSALFYAKALSFDDQLGDMGRIEAMKRLLGDQGARLRDGYRSVEELGAWVYEDLVALLDAHFPEQAPASGAGGETPRFLDLATKHFAGRAALLRRLDAQSGGPVALVGPVGIGKTAALAAWRRSLPEGESVSAYFATATNQPSWQHAARALLSDLGATQAAPPRVVLHVADVERHGVVVKHEIGDAASQEIDALLRSTTSLAGSMAEALSATAAAVDRVTVLVDGIDELVAADPEERLAWLPVAPPQNVRLIASTSDPDVAERLRRRGWALIEMPALDVEARLEVIASALGVYGKALDPERARRLAEDENAGLPLFLRTVLEEMRVFGRHEELDERLDHYLAAQDIHDLYDRVFARWEQIYEADDAPETQGLVGAFLGIVAVARRGILEADLIQRLSMRQGVPRTILDPLSSVAEALLQERDGRWTPGDGPMRQVIERRYLADPARRRALHAAIAEQLFETIHPAQKPPEILAIDAEDLEDLRFHLREAEQWERLAFSLSDGGMFATHTHRDLDRFIAHWRALARHVDPADVYGPMLAAPERYFGASNVALPLNNLAYLLMSLGRAALSEAAFRRVLDARLADVSDATTSGAHLVTSAEANLAAALEAQGKLDAAAETFASALARVERLEAVDAERQTIFLSHLARVAAAQSDAAREEACLRRMVELRRVHGVADGFEAAARLSRVLMTTGRAAEAAAFMRLDHQQVTAEQGPLHPDTATAAVDVAITLMAADAWDEAGRYLSEAERIAAQLPDPSPLLRIAPLGLRARWLIATDRANADRANADPAHADPAHADPAHADPAHADPARADAAEPLLREALDRLEEWEAPPFAIAPDLLSEAAEFWIARGDAIAARRALERLVSWPLSADRRATARCGLGATLLMMDEVAAAQAQLLDCVALQESAGRSTSETLQRALALLSEAAARLGQAAEADAYRQRAENARDLAAAWRLHNEGLAHLRDGNGDAAVARLQESVAIKQRVVGDDDGDTAMTMRLLGDALAAQGRDQEAWRLLFAAFEILEKAHPEGHPNLEAATSSIAHLGERIGAWETAENAYRRTVYEASRAFGDPSTELARSFAELGAFLGDRTRLDDAIEAFDAAIATLEKVVAPLAIDLIDPLSRRGRFQFQRGRFADAEVDFRRALKCRENAFGADHAEAGASLTEIGFALNAQGQASEAEATFRAAIDRLGAESAARGVALTGLANMLDARGALDDAAGLRREALAVAVRSYGADHPETRSVADRVQATLEATGAPADAAAAQVAEIIAAS